MCYVVMSSSALCTAYSVYSVQAYSDGNTLESLRTGLSIVYGYSAHQAWKWIVDSGLDDQEEWTSIRFRWSDAFLGRI